MNDYLWLYLVIIGQLLNAVIFAIDKYLLGPGRIGKPAVYAFYVGMLSIAVVWLLPFGVVLKPDREVIFLSLAIAFSGIYSILFLYKALRESDASDVAPVVIAVSSVATLILSVFVFGGRLPVNFFRGFPFLVAGTLLMSFFRFNWRSAIYAILAGVLFGVSSVYAKSIFVETGFWNGFFWSRMANVFGALFLLLWPANFRSVVENFKKPDKRSKLLVIFNKTLAGLAFLAIMLAINFSDAAVVNALSGLQFVFLLILGVWLTKKFPGEYSEDFNQSKNIYKKVIAAGLIIIGFTVLFL
jgi:drug/metabolite transporter (DMT)-like permease